MATDNPFVDPTSSFEDAGRGTTSDSHLPVGRDASLDIATDSLIVLGKLR